MTVYLVIADSLFIYLLLAVNTAFTLPSLPPFFFSFISFPTAKMQLGTTSNGARRAVALLSASALLPLS